MDCGHSPAIPPQFIGNNYAYWKIKMTTFLQAIDENVWLAIEEGWIKPETHLSQWTIEE
jgi:hypothetical protein